MRGKGREDIGTGGRTLKGGQNRRNESRPEKMKICCFSPLSERLTAAASLHNFTYYHIIPIREQQQDPGRTNLAHCLCREIY